MGFVIYTTRRARSIDRGQASIDTNGNCRFHPSDLAEVGIKGKEVEVYVDVATRRIALKAPQDNDDFRQPTAKLNRGKSGRAASCGIKGALAEIGIKDLADARGVYPVTHKDNLVIIQVDGASAKPAAKRK